MKGNKKDKIIKVLLVDDSPLAIVLLKKMLSYSTNIDVVGSASNGLEALKIIPALNPDVVCTDIHMPKMDGLTFIKELMAINPLPVLVISAYFKDADQQNAFVLLDAGAIDIFQKPDLSVNYNLETMANELNSKIKIISGVVPFTKPKNKKSTLTIDINKSEQIVGRDEQVGILAIGASTGGPQVLHTIIKNLPSNFPVPIICIQHISDGFLKGFVDWLSTDSQLPIKIVSHNEKPRPGTIYFPQENTHLEIDKKGNMVTVKKHDAVDGHKPSITVTFKSISEYYGKQAVGVLLTGMGKDGAEGLLNIKQEGGFTVAQDEASSVVFGMPRQAILIGAARCVLPLDEITDLLKTFKFCKCKAG